MQKSFEFLGNIVRQVMNSRVNKSRSVSAAPRMAKNQPSLVEILAPRNLINDSVMVDLTAGPKPPKKAQVPRKSNNEASKLIEELKRIGMYVEPDQTRKRCIRPPPMFVPYPSKPPKPRRHTVDVALLKKEQGQKAPKRVLGAPAAKSQIPTSEVSKKQASSKTSDQNHQPHSSNGDFIPAGYRSVYFPLPGELPAAQTDFERTMSVMRDAMRRKNNPARFSENSERILSTFPDVMEFFKCGKNLDGRIMFGKMKSNTGLIITYPGADRELRSTEGYFINILGITGLTAISIREASGGTEKLELGMFDYVKLKPNVCYAIFNDSNAEAVCFFLREV